MRPCVGAWGTVARGQPAQAKSIESMSRGGNQRNGGSASAGDLAATLPKVPERAAEPPVTDPLKARTPSLETTSDHNMAPGTVVGGQYRVESTLGEGGMGVVLKARDTLLERDVAIKVIRPQLVRGETRERFLVEAQAMARVDHHNVVRVHTYGEHDEAPYFIMEFVEGITAEQWFTDRRMLEGALPSIDEALGIFDQCCRGVTAIHETGTIHGDLKPSNVLLGPSYRVAITDLGLARMLDGDDFDQLAGTPAYMAPEGLEPAEDAELVKRRDVYSLGVIAYEMLTGQLPYEVCGIGDFVSLSTMGEPALPSELRADLPAAFDACLLKALNFDPQQRTASPDALRRELAQARMKASQSHAGTRIVVADDDEAILKMVRRTLEASFSDAEIVGVPDGARAIEAFEQRSTDLAVLDLHMPNANGLEVVAAIRERDPQRRTRILIVTAAGSGKDWQVLREMGADGFLVKPFDPAALTAMAGRMLGR